MELIILPLIASISAILFAGYLASNILKQEAGTASMKEISEIIREGAMIFLNRQYKTIAIFVVILTIILTYTLGAFTALAFVVGAFCSALAGYISMNIAIRANVRTAHATRAGSNEALTIAFRGGAVTGMCVMGLGLLGLSVLYHITGDPAKLVGFSFGGALIALFGRVGGGIYTKAADMGADLVGKIEVGIPEDDPRNPAVIADLVGDNVGDVAGMGADLFESYICAILAAMLIGAAYGTKGVVFPLAVSAAGIFSAILGTFFVRAKDGNLETAFLKGIIVTSILTVIASYFLTQQMFGDLGVFYATLVGIGTGISFALVTKYYTLSDHSPTRAIAKASQTGPAITILTGFATSLKSTAIPVIVVCTAIILAYEFAGIYGISLTGVGMVSISAIIVAMDSYGPIVDNAGGIIEMTGLSVKAGKIADELDSLGNTTKAVCKGFAIGAAALAAIALFTAYIEAGGLKIISIVKPSVVIGLFIGAMLPFLFCSFLIQAVGSAAFKMIQEVRRQFEEIPGLREGKAKPDYGRCIDISTHAALEGLVIPGLLAVITPIAVGLLFGAETVAGLLVGNFVSALPLALLLAHSGTAWDNAKKYIEAGNLGGKGSVAHKAAVIGDTVGDSFKDTAGPSLNILMDVMAIVALLSVQVFITYSLL